MSARQGEERGRGIPRSEEERRTRHEELYPGTPLPERGYGLGLSGEASKAPIVIAAILGIVGISLLSSRRK